MVHLGSGANWTSYSVVGEQRFSSGSFLLWSITKHVDLHGRGIVTHHDQVPPHWYQCGESPLDP
jgi:hypothetical protein